MNFDLSSLLIGVLIGAVSAFMLKLQSLRRLDLHLKQIGLSLGVEGFEQKDERQAGVTIRDIKDAQVGDIAGRDINKTSNLYRTVRAAIQAAERGSSGIVIRRPEGLQVKTTDKEFERQLAEIDRGSDDWFRQYVAACLGRREFKESIDAKIKELTSHGWITTAVTFDNIPGGLHVNFEVEQEYPQ